MRLYLFFKGLKFRMWSSDTVCKDLYCMWCKSWHAQQPSYIYWCCKFLRLLYNCF